jgi:hypothetical protein
MGRQQSMDLLGSTLIMETLAAGLLRMVYRRGDGLIAHALFSGGRG